MNKSLEDLQAILNISYKDNVNIIRKYFNEGKKKSLKDDVLVNLVDIGYPGPELTNISYALDLFNTIYEFYFVFGVEDNYNIRDLMLPNQMLFKTYYNSEKSEDIRDKILEYYNDEYDLEELELFSIECAMENFENYDEYLEFIYSLGRYE